MATFTTCPNGALVRSVTGSEPGHHTLLVAGQHGNEPGPIEALAGYHPKIARGRVTIIHCANPFGYQADWRYTGPSGYGTDMNRGWGRDSLNLAMWAAVMTHGSPDLVVDLHSASRSWWLGDTVDCKGRLVLVHADDPALDDLADGFARSVPEAPWKAVHHEHPEGSLTRFAADKGIAAFTVEFDRSTPARTPVAGARFGDDGVVTPALERHGYRKRTRHEQTVGVLDAVAALLARVHGDPTG